MTIFTSPSIVFRFIVFGTIAASGCASDPFEYKATVLWNAGSAPTVTAMTIDGHPYASGEVYTVDETFSSYDDAKSAFVPKTVVFTTTTGTATFQIELGACDYVAETMLKEPLVMESDNWGTSQQQSPDAAITLYVDCGHCDGKKQKIAWCS